MIFMEIGSYDPSDIWSLIKTAFWGLIAIVIIIISFYLVMFIYFAIKDKYFKDGK